MKPFFPFFGSKYRLAKKYPRPSGVVVEPFAGSACYSVAWGVESAILVDADQSIASTWDYLISATADEIMNLPDLPNEGDSPLGIGLHPGAESLIGFWLTKSAAPAKTRGAYAASDRWRGQFWRPQIKERIASQVESIRGWRVIHGDWRVGFGFADRGSTLFVDPPYTKAGHHYRVKFSEYQELRDACMDAPGPIIVTEGEGAEWLPFESLGHVKSFATGSAEEKVWMRL